MGGCQQAIDKAFDTFSEAVFAAYALYARAGKPYNPQTHAGRFFVFVFGWSLMLLSALYTANLARNLISDAARSGNSKHARGRRKRPQQGEERNKQRNKGKNRTGRAVRARTKVVIAALSSTSKFIAMPEVLVPLIVRRCLRPSILHCG